MKNSKNIKTMAIIGIVLFSVFAATVPTASAGKLVGLSTLVNVTWGDQVDSAIVPRQDLVKLDLNINFSVAKGWFLAGFVYNFYIGRQVNIKLEILETPTWCEASLSQGTLTTNLPSDITDPRNIPTKMVISVDPDAPAFAQGSIRVKATVEKIGAIDGFEQSFDLPIQPDYLPLVQPELPDTNTKRIGPMDTAVFPIEITNLGNARTKVFLEVSHAPDDWIAVVTDTIILDESEGSKNTAYLTVRPPKGFGYHDDDASIKVKITPAYADDTTLQGNVETLTVIVESRGISFIGAEVIFPIIILVIVLLVIIYLVIKRSKEK